MNQQAATLYSRLNGGSIVVAPGVFDALSAAMAVQAGFGTVYLSGASIAYTRHGLPDIGLVSMTEVASTLSVIRERIDIPVMVDADAGFGNALNVQRTVRLFERSGASAIQLEDQSQPKRCGHLAGKGLVSKGEMIGKLKAALDARASTDTLIIARTDAIAVEGFESAMARAEAYAEAGADMLFIEAPRTHEQLTAIATRFRGRVPLMANMVEGGQTPMSDAAGLEALGYGLVIFPGGLVRALAHCAGDYFASLKQHGSNQPFRQRMFDFDGLNEVMGTVQILETGRRYDAANFGG